MARRNGKLKMHRILIAIGLIISATASASAQEGQGYGLGMHSCAEFAAQYRASPVVTEDAYGGWAEGYMSGLNIEAAVVNLPEKNLSGLDFEALKVEIRSYCDAHPLAGYYMAVTAAYLERPELPKNSN
jgi:hypothetical protein